jgi:uncharacterized tellurite resistance protein B-like protein
MIASLKEFFTQFIEPDARKNDAGGEHALQVATAALLLEMMRMDNRIADEERATVAEVMRQQFHLNAEEFAAILALAERAAEQAHDYYQFTSLINERCDAAQKIRIVENLWRVAMADGHLDAHELHLMRKLGDLLHVGHADYVAAKQRAREAANLPADEPKPQPSGA